jgi:Apea-like HEPN
MLSFITEETHYRDTLAMRIHSLGAELAKAKVRIELELGSAPHHVYPSLQTFMRLVAQSRALRNRNYPQESFTLLMVALESLLVEGELIGDRLSRRAGAILAASWNRPFKDCVKSVRKLYEARSKFVHEGNAIEVQQLEELQEICRIIFFAACRSQARSAQSRRVEGEWSAEWHNALDYIGAAFDANVPAESRILNAAGIRKQQTKAPN